VKHFLFQKILDARMGKSVHAVADREDAFKVGINVVRGEGDELASALEHLAEEAEGVE
jgi:hypothetical protein